MLTSEWMNCLLVPKAILPSLGDLDESEEDLLDRAWGLEPRSRLSCQAKVGAESLVIEIPKYSINHAKEG